MVAVAGAGFAFDSAPGAWMVTLVGSPPEPSSTVPLRYGSSLGPDQTVAGVVVLSVPVTFAWLETTVPLTRVESSVASNSIWICELVVAPPGRVRPETVMEPGVPPLGWVTLVEPPEGVTVTLEIERSPAGRVSVMVTPFNGGQVKFCRSRV